MKPKFYLAASVVVMLVFVLVSGTAAAQSANACDPAFVSRSGNFIRVSPTGIDDTANIQCAFDWAIARGPGMTIRLQPGTFHTAQILAVDFHGAFRGSGVHATEILNLPNAYVIPDIATTPPSPENPWPCLFTFLDSDVDLSNLAIRVLGENPTTDWYIGDFGPFNQFGNGVLFSGTEAHVRVSNIMLEGEHSATSPVGYNVFNGIQFIGYVTTEGVDFLPLTGSHVISGSSFKTIGWPTDGGNLIDASMVFSHNSYSDVVVAIDLEDFVNASIKVFGNRIETNDAGILAYNALTAGDVATSYEIRNNIIYGPTGIGVFANLDEASTCLIKNNNLRWVTDNPILIGDGAACVLRNNRE
jgi:hypothetical protein